MASLRSKKVVVLGLLHPGVATIRFLHQQGALVKAFGVASEEDVRRIKSQLQGVEFELSTPDIPKGALLAADLIIQTPGGGRRYKAEIAEAGKKGIPIVTDLELACQFFRSPIIAVTGTNGKSTVIHMVKTALELAKKKVVVAGGDYLDFAASIPLAAQCDYILLELNSSRLDRAKNFHPHIAVLTNIYPGHAERYETFEEYISIKAKIFQSQDENDYLVHPSVPQIRTLIGDKKARAKRLPFSIGHHVEHGVQYDPKNNIALFRSFTKLENHFSLKTPALIGAHNIENYLAAIAVSKVCGLSDSIVQEMINKTPSLPDKMEILQTIDGITYINDAKAVNMAATAKSLYHCKDHSVVLITGGVYILQQQYQELIPLLKEKARSLIIFGEKRRRFYEKWKGATQIYVVPELKDAVRLATRMAEKGNVVLFSPASRPEPTVYATTHVRGEEFRRLVRDIAELSKARKSFVPFITGI